MAVLVALSLILSAFPAFAAEKAPVGPAPASVASAGPKSTLRELVEQKKAADETLKTATSDSLWARVLEYAGAVVASYGGALITAYRVIPDTEANQSARTGSLVSGACLMGCGVGSFLSGYLAEKSIYKIDEKTEESIQLQEKINEEALKY